MKTIEKTLIDRAEKLSAEWGNTGFIVENKDGTLEATVWNNWKWEFPQRPVVASVDRGGWLFEKGYNR